MGNISYMGIVYIILLVIPIFYINHRLEIKMNKNIVISLIRMVLQLSLVGIYLQYIFDLNNPILNIVYLIVMMAIATVSVSNSTELPLKKLYWPIFLSMAVPNLLMVVYFNRIVIGLGDLYEARYVITIGGMLLGNVLNGDIVGLTTFYKGIAKNRKQVNYDLSLGATKYQAVKPFLKDAVTASVRPTVASMATIGLVSLPGMMTGQILGGSVPMEAIMYQIAIMVAIFVTRYFNILGAIIFSAKLMFDKNDQLVYSSLD